MQKDWTSNSSCVAFVSVDGIFADQVQKGKLFATSCTRPEWSGYLYAKLADDVALGKKMPEDDDDRLVPRHAENAACALKMINDMKTKMKTFPFGPSLQLIARRRTTARCSTRTCDRDSAGRAHRRSRRRSACHIRMTSPPSPSSA